MLSLLQRSALPTLRARRAFSSASARLSSAAPADAAQPAPSSSAVSAAEAEAHAAALAHAKRELVATGYDADSLWEQRICWGDHDAVSLALPPASCAIIRDAQLRRAWCEQFQHGKPAPLEHDAGV
jgi:hypothetical protein